MGMYRLAIVAAVLIGAAAGVGGYTFVYARGASYLTNDPAACANCHVMSEHYAAWLKGSHRAVAVCNDCHTPHNIVLKYLTKGRNGFRHSLGFTTGRFPDPLQIPPGNYEIAEDACRKCHTEITQASDLASEGAAEPGPVVSARERHRPRPNEPLVCVKCHRDVGHAVR
ncbi:MAG: cytochrome c nitrite reductase small subunit [Gemmatimonadetes bacterium]|nr:cytochrome c nitrite reductase small subunit [Gemmatimonadota bacterium]